MRAKLILLGMGLVLLAGCDRSYQRRNADRLHPTRWQVVQQPDAAAVWRLDTATGLLSYCYAEFNSRLVLCLPQAAVPAGATSEAGTAPAGAAAANGQPVTAPPVYPGQQRPPAP